MRHYWLTCETPDLPADAFQRSFGLPGLRAPLTLEGGKGGGAPSAPDPYAVANATTQTNKETAAFNKAMNLNNYTNPFGSQQTNLIGVDSTGAPIYNTTESVNPQLQGAISGMLGQAGNAAGINTSALNGLMGLSSSLNPGAAQQAQQNGANAAYQSAMGYLSPQFAQQQQSQQAQLANQGLAAGSQAYTNATNNLAMQQGQQQQQAINNAQLVGSQIGAQNWQNQLAGVQTQAGLYGQQASIGQLPFSELGSLASLVPGYSGVGSSSAAPADIANAFNNQYQGQLAQYNANVQSQNSAMNGLFGLGAAGVMALALP